MADKSTTPTKDEILKQAVVFDNTAVTAAWQASDLSKLQFISVDKNYRALPKTAWVAILATHLSLHTYTTDFFDCDGFSAVFMGFVLWNYEVNGVARVFDAGGHHSYNAVLISDDGKTCRWEKVEPQSDLFVDDMKSRLKVTIPSGTYDAATGFAITA